MRDLRRWLPAVVLAAGCVLVGAARRQERVPLARPLETLPATIAGHVGADQTIGADEQRVAGMTSYVLRVFRRDSIPRFSVYVGYYDYQTQGKTIHSPKNCLPGAGWEALQSSPVRIAAGGREVEVNRYLLANGQARALVYYWYQGRGRIASSEYRVKWELLRDAARRGRTEEALVRIVVPIGADGEAAGDSLARAVAAELAPAVDEVLPSWGEDDAARVARAARIAARN